MSRLIRCDRCGKTLGTQEATYIIWPQAVDRYNRDFPVKLEQIYEKETNCDYCEECAKATVAFLHQKPVGENPPPMKKNARRRLELDTGKVLALRKAGWTIAKIADEMGVSQPIISRCLKEHEGELRDDRE